VATPLVLAVNPGIDIVLMPSPNSRRASKSASTILKERMRNFAPDAHPKSLAIKRGLSSLERNGINNATKLLNHRSLWATTELMKRIEKFAPAVAKLFPESKKKLFMLESNGTGNATTKSKDRNPLQIIALMSEIPKSALIVMLPSRETKREL